MLAIVPLLENGFARSKCSKAHVLQQADSTTYSLLCGADQAVQGIASNYTEDQACMMEGGSWRHWQIHYLGLETYAATMAFQPVWPCLTILGTKLRSVLH